MALSAPPASRDESRHLGLVFNGRIIAGRRAASVLQECHAAKAGFGFALFILTVSRPLLLLLVRIRTGPPAIGLLAAGLGSLLLALRTSLLAFLATLAPTLVVAVGEAAHRLDHAVIMVRILPVGFGHDPIARGRRLAGEGLVLVEYLVGIATHPHIGTAAIENLVSIWRTIGIVMLLLLLVMPVAAAAATTAAARPLTIVWSH